MTSYSALQLENDILSEVVGHLPQLQLDYQNSSNRGFDYENLHKQGPFDTSPGLNDYFLASGAKKTDLMSGEALGVHAGLFVSSRLMELLSKFPLGRHAFYPVPVQTVHPEDREEDTEVEVLLYYFLHLAFEDESQVDYSRSVLVNQIAMDEVLEIESQGDIDAAKEKFKFPFWKKVAFKSPLAMFRLYNSTKIYISPELAEAMKSAGITAAKIVPAYKGLEVEYD